MPTLSGPDRPKTQPSMLTTAPKGLDESLEAAPVARCEIRSILPPPALSVNDSAWGNDQVQFMRLLSEIRATVSLTPEQMQGLCESMDLLPENIDELFGRAQESWEKHLASLAPFDLNALKEEPHYKVEYDTEFFGGKYESEGQYAYVPESLVGAMGMDHAFEKVTGHVCENIIFYSEDERFTPEGNPFEELEDEEDALRREAGVGPWSEID